MQEVTMTKQLGEKNPLDDYLDTKLEKRAERDAKHRELWETWKADPNPHTLQPLLKQFAPVFGAATQKYKAPNVNDAAFHAEVQKQAIKSLETYDPNRGASLVTHVTNGLKKVQRFNTRVQNLAYIPEDKSRYIGQIDSATDELREELGRDPTHHEVGGIVGISGKRVKEIQGLRRADIKGSSFASDPVGHVGSRDQEVVALLRQELNGDEQKVYDYIFGQNGMPKIESTGEIARRMGKNPSQISRIKNRIGEAYKKYV
jgi:hypothetical protein